MRFPLPITSQSVLIATAFLISLTSCERRKGADDVTISSTELKILKEAHAHGDKVVKALVEFIERDLYTFTPIYGKIEKQNISNLLDGLSHVLCERKDGKSFSSEDRERVKVALKKLGYQDIGVLEFTQKSEQSVVPNP